MQRNLTGQPPPTTLFSIFPHSVSMKTPPKIAHEEVEFLLITWKKYLFPPYYCFKYNNEWVSKFSQLLKDANVTPKLGKKTTCTKDDSYFRYFTSICGMSGLEEHYNSFLSDLIPKIQEAFSI